MKFLYQTLATILGCLLAQYFLPWWTMAIAAFGFGYFFRNKGTLSFLAGFVSVGALWLIMAYTIDKSTQSLLTDKINKLFPLNVFLLMVIVGGLVGGFAALTGALMNPKKVSKYY
ncbi:MAG: hypothetical protein HY015_11100 [Bacteroidetes bacterium]|nr:hypothetical protein [Bacteroidota bacterium]MBI3483497.1 hypothetical protein [Bacteroidota bacterium]